MVSKSLVSTTGAVNEEELESASNVSPENEVQITNYTSDIDFYEQVNITKWWLVLNVLSCTCLPVIVTSSIAKALPFVFFHSLDLEKGPISS